MEKKSPMEKASPESRPINKPVFSLDSLRLEWMEEERLEKIKKWFFPGLVLLIALFVLLFRSCQSEKTNATRDYVMAFQEESKLFTPEKEEEAYAFLREIVQKIPNLQGEYDALLVQSALFFDHATEPMAERTFKRVGIVPSSQIALLIHENRWEEAYLLIQQNLDEERKKGEASLESVLLLFRKAFIEEKMGQVAQSQKSYQQLIDLFNHPSPPIIKFRESIEGQGEDFVQYLRQKTL